MGSGATIASGVNLDNTLGAGLVGLILVSIFFGITLVQTLVFFQNSRRDPTYLKFMIALLWSIDALQFALIFYYMYTILITDFGKLIDAIRIMWSWSAYVIASGTSCFPIRLYYARRIWILSNRNRLLTFIVGTMIITTYALNITYGVKLAFLTFLFEMRELSMLMYIAYGVSVSTDSLITVSLCYFLRKDRSGFGITDSIVDRLTIYIINSGLLTSLTAISCFVTFAAMPNNAIFIAIYSCQSKLYFNALLATLNTRKHLRAELTNKASSGACQPPGFMGLRSTPRRVVSGCPSEAEKPLVVSVNTETSHHMV